MEVSGLAIVCNIMKHLSFKTEIVLVTGAWFVASGLEIVSYLAATTPTEKFLAILVPVLMLIAVGMYIQSAVRRVRDQKVLEEMRGQIQEKIDEVQGVVSQVQS